MHNFYPNHGTCSEIKALKKEMYKFQEFFRPFGIAVLFGVKMETGKNHFEGGERGFLCSINHKLTLETAICMSLSVVPMGI